MLAPSSTTHRYVLVLLDVFSLLATQGPVSREVGVAGEEEKRKGGIERKGRKKSNGNEEKF